MQRYLSWIASVNIQGYELMLCKYSKLCKSLWMTVHGCRLKVKNIHEGVFQNFTQDSGITLLWTGKTRWWCFNGTFPSIGFLRNVPQSRSPVCCAVHISASTKVTCATNRFLDWVLIKNVAKTGELHHGQPPFPQDPLCPGPVTRSQETVQIESTGVAFQVRQCGKAYCGR